MIAALALAAALAVAPAAAGAPASTGAAGADGCTAGTGSWQWGVKESFRAYISGSIANGEWTVAGDIDYATPLFSSDAATGELALPAMTGALAVDGAIRFTGHGGILDTTIADPVLSFAGPDSITLVADITGTTQDFVPVDALAVPFVTGDLSQGLWSVDGDSLVIAQIPLQLTAEGAEAFGTYPEGEAFDPLTVTLPVGAACATAVIEGRASVGGATTALLVGLALAATALGGALTAVLVERARRRARAAAVEPEPGSPDAPAESKAPAPDSAPDPDPAPAP